MTATGSASIVLPSPGSYRIDVDGSTVHYSGKHMFGLGTVHGTFTIRHGELRVADPLSASSATVTVDAGSFSSNQARRDKDVRSVKFLDVDTHPDITFTADQLHETDEGWLVTGTVTAKAHAVPVDVSVDRVTAEGSGIRVHGTARHLDRNALGITGSKGMVGRYLDLELDALAVPA